MLKKPKSFLSRIRFSDECKITLDAVGIQFVRKRDDESWYDDKFIYEKQNGKEGKSIIIWAMIDELGLARMKWLNKH
jgi:hypothetical protein